MSPAKTDLRDDDPEGAGAGGRAELARVLDPAALDGAELKRAHVTLRVPAAWLERSTRIAFVVPKRLRCGSCDGGGCGSCDNRGGFALPSAADRRLVLSVSAVLPGTRIRVTPDLGPAAGIDLLLVDIEVGAPTLDAERVDPEPHANDGAPRAPAPFALASALVVAALLALALWLLAR